MASAHPRHDYAVHELLGMDEAEARSTLTVDQFERWEKLNDLHAEADATRERWADEDATVTDLTVHADPEQLGTHVDLYGNDVLVRVDPEAPDLKAAAEALDDEFGGVDTTDPEAIDAGVDTDRLADLLCDLLAAVIVRWNGHEWADLTPADRERVRAAWREKWGLDGLMLAKVEVLAAVEGEREERLDVIESFRSAERGRRR